MAILTSLWDRLTPRASTDQTVSVWGSLLNLIKTTAGVPVTEFTALTYAAYWAGVRMISDSIASVDLHLYRMRGGDPQDKELATDHPLYRLLHDAPNEDMGTFEFRESRQAHLLSWGNAYAEIERDGRGRVTGLWPLNPDRVTPDASKSGRPIYRVTNYGSGPEDVLPADRTLHVPGLGYDGHVGYSVVAMARQCLGLGLATERFGSGFFGNGVRASGMLKHPGKLSDKARTNLRESTERLHAGPDNAHRMMILEEGMDWVQTSVPPEDAQFLETRSFQREEIALWLNLPPTKLGVTKASTYASVEQFDLDYVKHTLRPWWEKWEGQIWRRLLTPDEQREYFAEHDADSLLRGDLLSRTQAHAQQFLNGALTLDEWRARENRNPVPDGAGKVHFVPLNLVPIERALAEPEPPAPVQAPPALPGKAEPKPEPPAKDGPQKAALAIAHRDAAAEVLGRMARRLGGAARRAAKDPARFLAWLDQVEADHGDVIRRALAPVAGVVGRPAESVAVKLVDDFRRVLLITAGKATLPQLASVVEQACERWEIERPAALAAELMVEELSHV